MDDDRLLTKQETADLLHVSVRTLDKYTAAGTGPPYIVLPGGQRRWRRAAVRAWMDEQNAQP